MLSISPIIANNNSNSMCDLNIQSFCNISDIIDDLGSQILIATGTIITAALITLGFILWREPTTPANTIAGEAKSSAIAYLNTSQLMFRTIIVSSLFFLLSSSLAAAFEFHDRLPFQITYGVIGLGLVSFLLRLVCKSGGMAPEQDFLVRLKAGLIQVMSLGGLVFLSKWTLAIIYHMWGVKSVTIGFFVLAYSTIMILILLYFTGQFFFLLKKDESSEVTEIVQEEGHPTDTQTQTNF